jgi:hypothetical protein
MVHPSLAPGDRNFRVDYTDLTTRARVIGATVIVARGQTGGTIPRSALSSEASPDPSTIQVYERLVQMTDAEYQAILAARNWDPADDTTWPRNVYYVNNLSTISGQILFSPALQVDSKPTDVIVAKVDYRVFDWQILVFDIEVPPGGMVQLPVHNIKSGGYSSAPRQPRPQEVARAVREYYDAAGNREPHSDLAAWAKDKRSWAYVIAIDRQTGDILTENEGIEWPTNAWMRRSRFKVDYNAGLLYFNYNPELPEIKRTINWLVDVPNRSGRTYRVLCRAQNDWAVQLMIASRIYARSSNPLSPSGSPVGITPGNTTMLAYAWSTAQTEKKQIYFPLSESGQTVAIDYYYTQSVPQIPGTASTTQQQVFVAGEVHTIGRPFANKISAGLGSSNREWVCQLTEPLAHIPNPWGPTSVRGISVPGRSTTFQDIVRTGADPKYGLTSAVRSAPANLNESWHQVIISTYLTRAPI